VTASAIVACGRGDVPDCTSQEAVNALQKFLNDPTERSRANQPGISASLAAAEFQISNIHERSVDPSMRSVTCVATVSIRIGGQSASEELQFSDHFPGDKLHVISADLTAVDRHILSK
jgi:hypothetical protein